MLHRITLFLIVVAFSLIIAQSWGEVTNAWMVVLFLGIGFILGKITCSTHLKKAGFWITIALFALLNIAHSMIDGISILASTSFSIWTVVLLHEIIRQPLLYVIMWGLLMPFRATNMKRMVATFFAVTGTWMLGMYLGSVVGTSIETIEWVHPYLAGSLFILAGDMIHHIWDRAIHTHR
jgi:hypothetical protein